MRSLMLLTVAAAVGMDAYGTRAEASRCDCSAYCKQQSVGREVSRGYKMEPGKFNYHACHQSCQHHRKANGGACPS